jgi:hexosaminidase
MGGKNWYRVPILFCLASLNSGASPTISIIPEPVRVVIQGSTFPLSADTIILTDSLSIHEGQQLAEMLRPATGFALEVKSFAKAGVPVVEIHQDPSLLKLGEEGYQLKVTPQKIWIRARKPAGLFYAFQTIRQLMPTAIFQTSPTNRRSWDIPGVLIEDYPRFPWRGMLLDSARYFTPIEFVRKFIDLLALHKMNFFYWHLTDDQGWRMEIKKYPRLTLVGAWRKETLAGRLEEGGNPNLKFDGTPHGGFYTQNEIREIVEYARQRHVVVVPDIEMPGHAQAAIAAYPELGNSSVPLDVATMWGISENIFNVKETTIQFLQDVLAEVLDVFPSPYIGTGGDEVPKTQWKANPEAQSRMKELGLRNEEELQSYFTHRINEFLASKGRRMIWDEDAMKGGLAPNSLMISWRGVESGVSALHAGHEVVMSPDEFTYFDYYQSHDTAKEPLAIGGFLPLEKVYQYEPIPSGIPPKLISHLLGVQGNLWTEYIPNPSQLEYMAFPRVSALAEVAWTPREKKGYPEFLDRLSVHLERLRTLKVHFRPL